MYRQTFSKLHFCLNSIELEYFIQLKQTALILQLLQTERWLTDDVLEDEVPADDEGGQLSDSDVAVDVGRTRLRYSGSELRVTQT